MKVPEVEWVRALFADGDGSLWFSHAIGTNYFLTRLKDGHLAQPGPHQCTVSRPRGPAVGGHGFQLEPVH